MNISVLPVKKTEEIENIAQMLGIKNSNIEQCNKLLLATTPLDKNNTYELQFAFLQDRIVKYSFKYTATVKNGFFLLNNYTSFCHGIPYLFGGCRSFQSRIGLTKDHHLIIQDYYDNSGGALFVLGSGYTINYAEKYKRINHE